MPATSTHLLCSPCRRPRHMSCSRTLVRFLVLITPEAARSWATRAASVDNPPSAETGWVAGRRNPRPSCCLGADNAAIFKGIDLCSYRHILQDDGCDRLLVEVENVSGKCNTLRCSQAYVARKPLSLSRLTTQIIHLGGL